MEHTQEKSAMADVKHTPGPWSPSTISQHDGSIGVTAGRIVIAQVHNAASFGDYLNAAMRGRENTGDATKTQWENAHLIAAAPDLLEALKYARRFLHPADHDTAFIDAVIAKATGAARATEGGV